MGRPGSKTPSRSGPTVRVLALCVLATCPWVAGCTGQIGAAGEGSASHDDPHGDDALASTDLTTGDGRLPARVWRLSTAQVQAELTALFGADVPRIDLLQGAPEHHITNVAENAGVDIGNVDNLINGARAVAAWVVAGGGQATRCGADYGSDACLDTLLDWLPAEAYRRPVTAEERSELRALHDAVLVDFDRDAALSAVIRAVLMSPDFLYRTELGPVEQADAPRVTMTDHEIATLIAYAITDRGPDADLVRAADDGMLGDPDEREAQARRLAQSSGPMWQRFFWEWLHMETFRSQSIEVALDPKLADQMAEEYDAFLNDVIVDNQGTLPDVFGAPYTLVGPELAQHYGATHPGGGVARVDLDPDERGGLLTQGAWLVAHGKAGRDNVVRRGMGIFREGMCNDIRPPDGVDVNAELAKLVGPDASVRETVDARGSSGTCAGCHSLADPVGLAFESYASDGSWQSTYPDGRPVDTQVELDGIGSFDRAPAMSAALAEAERFRSCFIGRFALFMLGRDIGDPASVPFLQRTAGEFGDAGDQLTALLVAMVRSPEFIERASAGETP